jgi:hypothetical protein
MGTKRQAKQCFVVEKLLTSPDPGVKLIRIEFPGEETVTPSISVTVSRAAKYVY